MSEVEVGDQALFDGAVSDEPETPVVAEEPVAQLEPAPSEDPSAAAEPNGDKPPIPPKPEWRLKEDAERARAAETELANERAEKAALRQRLEALERVNQPAAPKVEKVVRPDPLLDPDGYADAIRQELREEAQTERRNESMARALETKPEEFKAAYKAATENGVIPELKTRMQNSRDPGKELLAWHKEQAVKAEVGSDPNAWLEKKLEERLKDPAFLAKAVELARGSAQSLTDGRPNVDLGRRPALSPSLSATSRANAAVRSTGDEPTDQELFEQTIG